jgi:hypothetical protein
MSGFWIMVSWQRLGRSDLWVWQVTFGRVSGPAEVLEEILDRFRPVCLGLPQACEQRAWVGHAVADPAARIRACVQHRA